MKTSEYLTVAHELLTELTQRQRSLVDQGIDGVARAQALHEHIAAWLWRKLGDDLQLAADVRVLTEKCGWIELERLGEEYRMMAQGGVILTAPTPEAAIHAAAEAVRKGGG